ncbi:MAG: Ig-like domain-containing protein [Candidatus Heimdallarchaeota archaeon]
MDIGSCPGKRNSILGYDIDGDGATEAIISDSFGQIFIIGEGPNPEITITSPSSGTSNKQNILLEWEISNESLPIDSISIYLNGFLEYKTGGSQDSAIIPLEAGSNNIDIYCIDVTSKIAFDYISIVYSASAPEIDITLPTNYYVTDSSSIRVEFWADDPDVDDTLSFDVYRNSSLQAVTPTPIGSDNYYVDVDLPSDGLWLITIVVSDGTNEANDSVYVIRDTVNPVVTITSPLDGSAIKSTTIDLYWDAYDDSSWIEYCEVYRNEILLGVSYSNSYLDIALVSDDIYSLKVVAYDAIGKFSEDIVYITRDTGTPYAYLDSLSLPANYEGYYYTSISSVFVSWYGEDNVGGTGLDKFELIVDGTSFDFSPDVLNTTILLSSEGPNEIRIIAWDFAGNSAFDFYIIAYDTQNPDVNITSPEDDFVTSSDTVNVKWNGFDEGAGIEYYEIIVNGTLVEIITDISTSSYLVDLPEEKDYIITVKAVDFLGNFDEDTILVRRDADTPTFYINIPEDLYSYSTSPLIFVSWGITNIFLDTFEIFVDGIHYNSYPNTTFSDLVDVTTIIGIIPEDSFPEVNITIAVNNGGIYTWVLSRFVTIDQSSPLVSILTPENNDEIPEDSLYISWSGFDTGSGIDQYILYINNRLIQYYGSSSVDTTLDISSYEEGYYNITLSAFDYAGNCDNSSIIVEFYPNPPEFNVDLPSFVITNDPNFPINVQVTNVGYGVELIQIIADNIIIVDALNFEGDIQYDPDSYLFAITDDDFLIEIDDHNLTITVYDQASRWSNIFVDIVIDYVAPTIFDRPILGDTRISLDLNILEITDVYDENVYDISITTRDTNGVGSVSLNITNDTTTFQYNMILNKGQSIGDIFVFEVTIDFNIFAAGVYEFKFDAVDVAGNSISSSYSFNITIRSDGPPTSPPIGGSKWLRENLFTIVIPSTGGILFIILLSAILSVTTRKKRLNRGWEDAIVAVAYVTKTGLTLTYVPYSPDLFEDEQLFGGALTGIMSILGEITGETEVAMKVHVMEYGDKRLMICSGYFGNGILLVTDVKSKLKELLKQFINDFETAYKFSLTQELIDLNEYSSAPLLVESIFGFRKNIFQRQTDQLLNTIDTQDYSTPEHDTSHQTNQDIAVSYYQENYEENANNEYRNEEY